MRVPLDSPNPRNRRIEYRGPDSASNPYLLFPAMLMAILDGIQNKIRPGEPLDKDIYDLQPEELDTVPATPRSLEASLEALRADHEFLLRGDVFTPDVIDTWIWYKQTHEVDTIRVRPHPVQIRPLLRRMTCESRSRGTHQTGAATMVTFVIPAAARHRCLRIGCLRVRVQSHPVRSRIGEISSAAFSGRRA